MTEPTTPSLKTAPHKKKNPDLKSSYWQVSQVSDLNSVKFNALFIPEGILKGCCEEHDTKQDFIIIKPVRMSASAAASVLQGTESAC